MAIQSEFHKDLSKFEPTYRGGMTKRQLKTILTMLPGTALVVAEILFLQGIAFWSLALATTVLFIVPPYLKGTGKWQAFKTDIDFQLKHQDRYYQSGQIRRYAPHEFLAQKGVKETDSVGSTEERATRKTSRHHAKHRQIHQQF